MYSAHIYVCVFIHICIVITLEYLIIIDNYTPTIIILRILSENIVFVHFSEFAMGLFPKEDFQRSSSL